MNAVEIAIVCHEANRALTRIIGDVPVQPEWEHCGADMQRSCINGVTFALNNPDAPPSAQHDAWMKERIAQGWTFGTVKDGEKKTHPALMPYGDLHEAVKRKDVLFKSIVTALR